MQDKIRTKEPYDKIYTTADTYGELRAELDKKSEIIDRLRVKMKMMRERNRRTKENLVEMTAWANRLDAEMREKDEEILQIQRELDEKTSWANRLDAEMREKDREILSLRDELDDFVQPGLPDT